jgi:uncharacterized protein (DUF924 family)
VPLPNNVLDFWFTDDKEPLWFAKNTEFDALISATFFDLYHDAVKGKLESWRETPEGVLALVITLDQFPRNMFRGTPQAFASDEKALDLTKYAINNGFDRALADAAFQQFLYMPLMHSETLADQALGLKMFAAHEGALAFAGMHYRIIERFGRFPHRNDILGRLSTPEELEFLTLPNSSF